MGNPTKVYILGAGCSVCGGYPLASSVTTELANFAKRRLGHKDAEKLRGSVEQTCRLLNEHGVDTIDQLAKKLRDTDRKAIEESKISISALFFELEDAGAQRAYSAYAAFFAEVFRYGNSADLEERVKATPCRVLTFNYDRLFERTFILWAKQELRKGTEITSRLNEFLNMSLGQTSNVLFKPDRFTFLKLHGGIGQFYRTGDHDMNHTYWPDFGEPIPPFNDEPYFSKNGQKSNRSTIVFPHEKDYCEPASKGGGHGSSFVTYMRKLEEHAKEFCRTASEIQIIGYSIQSVDYFWFKKLLLEAKHCNRIVIRNQGTVEAELREKIEGLKEEFRASWQIEYRSEDFFGIRPASSA